MTVSNRSGTSSDNPLDGMGEIRRTKSFGDDLQIKEDIRKQFWQQHDEDQKSGTLNRVYGSNSLYQSGREKERGTIQSGLSIVEEASEGPGLVLIEQDNGKSIGYY